MEGKRIQVGDEIVVRITAPIYNSCKAGPLFSNTVCMYKAATVEAEAVGKVTKVDNLKDSQAIEIEIEGDSFETIISPEIQDITKG